MTTTNYEQQAAYFLNSTQTTFECVFVKNGKHFYDDTINRDIYKITLKRGNRKYSFNFGQSFVKSGSFNNDKEVPTAYDVLSCLTKYPVYDFTSFCREYGYDEDSRKAYKTYKEVKKEWENLTILFNDEELDLLREIE